MILSLINKTGDILKNRTVIVGLRSYALTQLPTSSNIILIMRHGDMPHRDVNFFYSIDDAIESCDRTDEIFILGDHEMYEQMINRVDRLYIYKESNIQFPKLNLWQWDNIESNHDYLVYERKVIL